MAQPLADLDDADPGCDQHGSVGMPQRVEADLRTVDGDLELAPVAATVVRALVAAVEGREQ